MLVRTLIEILQTLPPDVPVVMHVEDFIEDPAEVVLEADSQEAVEHVQILAHSAK